MPSRLSPLLCLLLIGGTERTGRFTAFRHWLSVLQTPPAPIFYCQINISSLHPSNYWHCFNCEILFESKPTLKSSSNISLSQSKLNLRLPGHTIFPASTPPDSGGSPTAVANGQQKNTLSHNLLEKLRLNRKLTFNSNYSIFFKYLALTTTNKPQTWVPKTYSAARLVSSWAMMFSSCLTTPKSTNLLFQLSYVVDVVSNLVSVTS